MFAGCGSPPTIPVKQGCSASQVDAEIKSIIKEISDTINSVLQDVVDSLSRLDCSCQTPAVNALAQKILTLLKAIVNLADAVLSCIVEQVKDLITDLLSKRTSVSGTCVCEVIRQILSTLRVILRDVAGVITKALKEIQDALQSIPNCVSCLVSASTWCSDSNCRFCTFRLRLR